MAELQKSDDSSENSARFVEFVMMQAQNASLFLGLIPNPHTGEPEVNLDLARMFVDQLSMIQGKTRGNLTSEESSVLRNALSNLQMAFYEVSQGRGKAGAPPPAAGPAQPPLEEDPAREDGRIPAAAAEPAPEAAPATAQQESRKRFSKSYGS
jgi:hypothetical protein